jgi:hypothetical protein
MAYYIVTDDWTYYCGTYEYALRLQSHVGGVIHDAATFPEPVGL